MRNLFLATICSLAIAFSVNGCGEDPLSGGQNDTSGVATFSNRVLTEWFDETSLANMNLFEGTVVSQSNNANWDMKMISAQIGADFYLRSGDLGDNADVGFLTRFGFVSSDMSQIAFDTLSSIAAGDSLGSEDFTQDNTRDINGVFQHPLTANRVYSFYLAGRDNIGFNGGVPIFGVIRIDGSSQPVVGGPINFTFDIKINTKGKNQFVPDPVITAAN